MLALLQSFAVQKYPDVHFAFEKRHDRRSLLRVLRQDFGLESKIQIMDPSLLFWSSRSPGEPRSLQCLRPGRERGGRRSTRIPILKNRGAPRPLLCQVRRGGTAKSSGGSSRLGPRVWDDHAPLDPDWDQACNRNPW
eukprot:g42526.t1